MATNSLTQRVERLELTVGRLETLPSQVADLAARTAAVESQILQLRSEMRAEFSAVRGELRGEIQEAAVCMATELGQRILDAESRSRAMFEEILSRLTILGEGRKPPR